MASIAPGLDGFLAQRQMASQQDARGMQQIQGLLGIQQAMQEQQLMPLKVKQIEQSLAAAKRKEDMIAQIFGGGQPPSPGGLLGNNVNSAPGAAPGGILGILSNPAQVAALKVAGIDFTDLYKHLSTPQKREGGSTYVSPINNEREFFPKVAEGMVNGPGGVSVAPGYLPSLSAITSAQEGAKAGLDFVDVPMPGGGTQKMTRADAARMLSGGQSQPAPQPSPMPQGAPQTQQDPLISQGFSPQQAQTLRMMDAPGAPPMSMSIPASQRPAGGIPASNVVGGGFGVSQSDTAKASDKVYAEGRAKFALERETKLQQSWGESYGRVQQLDLIENLMTDPNVVSGGLAESISNLKGVADSLGINVKGKSAEDVITAVTGEMALKMRLQGGENLMPGQMSNFEQQLLRSMSPSLSQSREGRMLLIQVGKAKAEKDMKISELAADYVEKNGKLDAGFDRQVREFSRSNPMFSPERIKAMTELAKRLGGR